MGIENIMIIHDDEEGDVKKKSENWAFQHDMADLSVSLHNLAPSKTFLVKSAKWKFFKTDLNKCENSQKYMLLPLLLQNNQKFTFKTMWT